MIGVEQYKGLRSNKQVTCLNVTTAYFINIERIENTACRFKKVHELSFSCFSQGFSSKTEKRNSGMKYTVICYMKCIDM